MPGTPPETTASNRPAQAPADRWALFLDFDGALVDIADTPEAVSPPAGLACALARLRDRVDGALAIVSGRPLAILDRFLAPHRFDAAGVHGAERRAGGRVERHPDGLQEARARLCERLPSDAGLRVEDKGCALTVHWRLAPHLEGAAITAIAETLRALGSRYRVQHGKCAAEILPRDADKGRAIEAFLGAPPYQGRRPLFIGDDLTDEHGFAVVNRRCGVSARVGPGQTCARFRLGAPQDVRACVHRWAAGAPINPEQDLRS